MLSDPELAQKTPLPHLHKPPPPLGHMGAACSHVAIDCATMSESPLLPLPLADNRGKLQIGAVGDTPVILGQLSYVLAVGCAHFVCLEVRNHLGSCLPVGYHQAVALQIS